MCLGATADRDLLKKRSDSLVLDYREEEPSDVTQESVKLKESLSGESASDPSARADISSFDLIGICVLAKRSVLLNMTSGSLEAFGGDVSRAEL